LPGTLEDTLDLALVTIGHGGDYRLLVFEISIDQTDANSRFSADIVHAGLVEAALGEADQGSVKDLLAPILG
jgi:hypothetical protein